MKNLNLITLLATAFLLPSVHAENLGPLTLPPQPRYLEAPADFRFSKEEINACITSICGEASRNMGPSDIDRTRIYPEEIGAARNKNEAVNYANLWSADFYETLQKNHLAKKEIKILSAKILQKSLDENLQVDEKQPLKALAAYARLSALLTNLGDLLEVKNGKMQGNAEGVAKRFATAGPTVQRAALLILDQIILPMYASNEALKKDPIFPLRGRLDEKFPGLNKQHAQEADATITLRRAKAIRQTLGEKIGPAMMDDMRLALLERARSGEDLSKSLSVEYLNAALDVEFYGPILDGGELYQLLMQVPVPFAVGLGKLKASGDAAERLLSAQNFNPQQASSQVSAACQSRLKNSLEMNASDLRLRRLPLLLAEIKKASEKVAVGMSEPGFIPLLRQRIQTLEFVLPESRTLHVASLTRAFERQTSANERTLALYRKFDPEIQQMLLLTSLIGENGAAIRNRFEFSKNEEITDACNALPVDKLDDHAITSFGRVQVSWTTAAYPQSGSGIVAHEIGHVISALFRNQQYTFSEKQAGFSTALSCVANRNPFVAKKREYTGWGNTPWSEEDFADYFSSLVMQELKGTEGLWQNSRNMGCALISTSDGQYAERLEPRMDDSHSSGFLRLLMILNDRGERTPQCAKFIAALEKRSGLNCQTIRGAQ